MSIKLGTPYSIPGQTTETDQYAALMQVAVNFATSTWTFVFQYGTAALNGSNTSGFTPGQEAPQVILTANYSTGAWTVTTITGTFTLTAGEQTTLTNLATSASNAIVNSVESFANNHNLFGAGTTLYTVASGTIQ